MDYTEVIHFWFSELAPRNWFEKDPALDKKIRDRFGQIHAQAISGELYTWRDNANGRLAEILILDQFSRNIYRDRPESFAYDGMALVLAQEAIHCGADQQLVIERRKFIYMPYMHSESRKIHELSVKLFAQPGLEENFQFAVRHKEIIERFGRFPHRNIILHRLSTEQETEFLKQPGSSF